MAEEGGARVRGDDWILTVNLFLVYHTEAAGILNHDVNNDSDEDADCVEGYIRNENRLFFSDLAQILFRLYFPLDTYRVVCFTAPP